MVSRVNPFIVTVVVLTVVIAPVNAATVAVGAPQATASSADSGLQTQAASDTGASTSEQNPGAQGIATNESTSPSRASSDPSDDPEECKRKTDSEERRGNESEEKPPRRPPDECEKDTSKEDAESSGVEKQDGLGTMDVQIQNATQDLRSIGINQTANGTIDTNDPYDTGFRGYYEPVTFNGTEGQLLKFNMRSSGDTYLYLVDPNGTVVASDDDGGDGYNSEIVRELQSTGNYTIIATSYDSDATFEYELTVEVPRDRDLRSTSVGGAVYSTIEGDDPYNSSLGAHYEPVTFQGEAGEEVSIRMQASGSRQLMLVAPNGSVITKSGEYPARIEATLPTTGNYTIIAATYDDNLVPYHLSVLRDDHKDPSRVAIGNTIKGTVDTDDSYNESFGGYYEGVSFDGQAGQDVSISFESLEYYNKIIYLVAPNGTVLLQSYVNQEATALTARLPTNGTYRVLVTSDQYGFQTFDYRLGVRTADHGDARSISYDDSVTSTLENGDPKNSTYDGYYEPVTFDGQAGDNISLSFNSEVYYGTIQLLAPNGTVMATSSEYGSGDIKAQLPTDGTYTVIVSSYYDYVQVFDYQLSLTRDSHEDLRSITQNTTRSSTLDTNDSVNSSYRGKYHEPVVFEGTAGQEVNVSMQANGEDTYLYLLAPNGTVIAENDYANIYGSRVSVTLPVTGNYTIIAASDDYDSDTFDYDLSVTVNQSDLRSIEANESMEGEIETSDPQNSTYNGYYEPVSYNGTAGERVSFETTTAEDTYLYLVAPNGTIIAENDDGGFYDSSEIAVTLPENGTYTVIVTSDYSGDTFPYLLSVDSEPVSTDLRSIGVNQTLQGEIDAADPSNSSYDGIHEPVTVNATAGEEVTITVTPSEEESTDTYLYVVSPNGTVISQADYGVVHGSRVDVSFPTNGTYTIIVATDYGNDRFKYELSVEPANHGDVRSVTVGSTVISTVDTDDPASNRFNGNYEPITFYGEAGQEISISRLRLRSEYYDGEFNLTVLSPNGTVLTKTRYYEETDVKMVLPETGNYTIVASPQRYYNNITGDYAFSIVNDTHRNARTVDLNQGVMGTLDTGDPSNSTYDGYYESIAYDGEAGQKVRIDLLPDDVQYADSYLYLVAPNGTVIAEDDYGGEGGSRIETTLPVNGTYQIIVSNDYYDRHLFDYRLSVTSMAGTPASGTANLSVSKYALSSTSVTAGESLNVTANVVNDGGISGSMTVTLYVNGSAAGQKTVTVGPGESTTVPFSVTFDAAGTKAVRVNGLAPTEVSVEPAVGTRTLSRAWTLPLDRPKTQLALGDIDADGAEEIGVGNFDSHGPTTYGVVKDGAWTWNASASAAVHPDSVGDVDGSGEPEMIFKAKVDATWVRPYDANGSSQWSGTHPDWVDQTLTVDSDDDGKAEVLAYSGNGGDLSIWDDNGSEITTAQNSSINNLLDAGDIDGDGVPEVLTNLPSTDYDGLQVLSIAVSDGSVERVATYGPEQPVRATFTDLDDDSRYEIVAAYPSGGFVTAYDINGTVQWNRTIASGDDARLRNVTGDDVPDPVVWNGSNVTVMDGATGDTVRTNVSNTVRSALGRGDGSVAVLTESSVTVVADGQVVDSVAVDGTNVTAFAGGDTDGDDEEELVVANKSLLTVYDVNVTEETASFQVRDISAPPSASVGSDVVVSADVVNTGNVSGTQTVEFTYETGSGAQTVTRDVTLGAGESTRVAFTFGSGVSNAGSYTAGISTANDSANTSVEFTDQQFVCGVSTGDPHFVTFDGVAYDFQGVGEFVLVRDENRTNATNPLVVQVRHIPVAGSTSVSITNATATIVDGHQVQINAANDTPLSIDGSAVSLADGASVAVGNGSVKRTGNTYTIIYPGDDGVANASDERLQVDVVGNRIDLRLCLDPDRSASVEGLLGSPNGNASDDLALDNGTIVGPDIDTDTLYGSYRDSWRVTNNTTVFTYENGHDPGFFYDPNYPEKIVTLSDLNDTVRERAEELAIEAGLEPGTAAFRDAVIDYALTGDSSYFASATTSSTSNVSTDATDLSGVSTAVELVPANTSAVNGTTVAYDVVVTDAYGGVGAYNATVAVANGSVGEIRNVTLGGGPGFSSVALGNNNTSVTFDGALANTTDTGDVTIATVTVLATGSGETEVTLDVRALGNETGASYNITRTTGSRLDVQAIGKLRDTYSGPPTDVDGDGVYEDINGDGKLDIVDVQALYTVRKDSAVQNNAARFDVNDDGVVDIVDVQALYTESQG